MTGIQRYLAGLLSLFNPKTPDDDALYAAAVRDAMAVSEDEIMPFVNITKDDENVIWDGDKVLVLFMHKYPDSYPTALMKMTYQPTGNPVFDEKYLKWFA